MGSSKAKVILTAITALITVGLLLSPAVVYGETPAVDIKSSRQPFVDKHLIDSMRGAALELQKPIPRDIVFRFDKPWEGNTSAYYTILKNKDRYLMYYRCSRFKPITNGEDQEVTCLAESKDGIVWERPSLNLVTFQGSRDNNILFAGDPSHAFAPFYDRNPSASKDAKFKAVGVEARGPRGWNWALFAYKSPDGIRWSKMQKKPILTGAAFDTLNQALWDPVRKQYVVFFREFRNQQNQVWRFEDQGFRDIKVAYSKDFINWSAPLWQDYNNEGPLTTDFYTSSILTYPGNPSLYFNIALRYVINRSQSKANYRSNYSDLIFLTSRSAGRTWNMWPQAFLRPGLSADRWQHHVSNLPARGLVDTRTDSFSDSPVPETVARPIEWSFYAAEGFQRDVVKLRRYTLRQHGFVAISDTSNITPHFRNGGELDAEFLGGEVITKPLTFKGSKLFLNYSTSANGGVRVELQDVNGTPIDGYSLSDSSVLFGDQLDKAVTWKRGRGVSSDISSLVGKTIRIRFIINDADIFALQFR
jgi:hypothetical protein